VRILLAVPTATPYIRTDCVKSLFDMRVPGGIELQREFITGYSAAQARNKACNKALDENWDYLLFVDGDQILPAETLEKLLAIDTPVAAGYSMMAVADQRTNISVYDPDKRFYDFMLQKDVPENKLIKVDAIGFAAVLIKTEVLKKLQYPYFKYVEYDNRTTLSEDLYFCDTLRKNNIDMVCDTSLRVWHSKSINI